MHFQITPTVPPSYSRTDLWCDPFGESYSPTGPLHPEEEIVEAIVRRELSLRTLRIDRVSEGWTNRNYKVQTEAGLFIVRIGTDHPESLAISREKEGLFHEMIRPLDITPSPVFFEPRDGTMICPFIEGTSFYGKVLGQWTGKSDGVIGKIVALMKRIHSIKAPETVEGQYPIFAIIEKYAAECHAASVSLPKTIEQALEIVATTQRQLPTNVPMVLCHHDFFWENLLFDGEKLWIVDWEYADWDDPFSDLAGFCTAHRLLSIEERDLLLGTYCSTYGDAERRKLALMCMLSSLKTALWGYLQIALCPDIPFNIRPIADMHYDTFWQFHQELTREIP